MAKIYLGQPAYWLFKTEPSTYSIDNLQRDQATFWGGIRNYQVRNLLRDQIKSGDKVLVYHSSASIIGVVGEAMVISGGAPDPTQFDRKDDHFDPKSNPQDPRWFGVEVQYVQTFKQVVTLSQLRQEPKLADLVLLQKGNRLSITPVTKNQYEFVRKLALLQK